MTLSRLGSAARKARTGTATRLLHAIADSAVDAPTDATLRHTSARRAQPASVPMRATMPATLGHIAPTIID